MQTLIESNGRMFLPLSPVQAATVHSQGGPLFLADGELVLEVPTKGAAMRLFSCEWVMDISPLGLRRDPKPQNRLRAGSIR
jgi:hypothetical protein